MYEILFVEYCDSPGFLTMHKEKQGLGHLHRGYIFYERYRQNKKEIQGLIPGKKAPDRNLDSTERIVLLYMFAISCDGKSALQHV